MCLHKLMLSFIQVHIIKCEQVNVSKVKGAAVPVHATKIYWEVKV